MHSTCDKSCDFLCSSNLIGLPDFKTADSAQHCASELVGLGTRLLFLFLYFDYSTCPHEQQYMSHLIFLYTTRTVTFASLALPRWVCTTAPRARGPAPPHKNVLRCVLSCCSEGESNESAVRRCLLDSGGSSAYTEVARRR